MSTTTLLEQATALHKAGQTAEAAEMYKQVLALAPGNPQAAHGLGVLMIDAERYDEAVELLAPVARMAPQAGEVQNRYGIALRGAGRIDEAIAAFRGAVAVRPNLLDAHLNLAESLMDADELHAALAAATAAHTLAPDHAAPLVTLGMVHLVMRDWSASIEALRAALAIDPEDPTSRDLLRTASRRLVDAWHFPMMNETRRNDAYDAAIRRAVKPGALVFDLGAGAGLLSMMAARAGAGRVVACEMVPPVALKAQEIVALNGYASVVTVHGKRSQEIEVGVELPEPADVLVSEVLDSSVLGEGVLESLEDAHARLIKPGATVIPRAASAMIVLAGGAWLERAVSVRDAAGFDMRPFNEFAPDRVTFDAAHVDFERYSEPLPALRFDFREASIPDVEHTIEVPITRSGVCAGVIQWLHIELDDVTTYENAPEPSPHNPANWLHSLYPFEPPVRVEAGQTLKLVVGHGRRAMTFRPA